MRVRIGCEFEIESDGEVGMLMLVRPRPDADHRVVQESQAVEPTTTPLREYVDGFGNRCWRFRTPAGLLQVRYDAVAEVPDEPDLVVPDAMLVEPDALPDDTLVFTLPSRYVPSDLLLDRAWQLFGATPPTWARVQAIVDWVHGNVRYETGSSAPSDTALETFERRVGVCRDFALLAVALCRAMNIPARYTFGYLPDIGIDPPDIDMDFDRLVRGVPWRPLVHVRRAPQSTTYRARRGGSSQDVTTSRSPRHYGSTRLNRMVVWADEVAAVAAARAR